MTYGQFPTISVFFPEMERTLKYDSDPAREAARFCHRCEHKISCPTGILTIESGECRLGKVRQDFESSAITRIVPPQVFVLGLHDKKISTRSWKQDKSAIQVGSYQIANVYSNHFVCWGSGGHPKDLRTAAHLFWDRPFNRDLTETTLPLREYLEKWNPPPADSTLNIFERPHAAREGSVDRVVIGNKQNFLHTVPPDYRRVDYNNKEIAIAWCREHRGEVLLTIPSPKGLPSLVILKKKVALKSGKILGTTKDFPNLA